MTMSMFLSICCVLVPKARCQDNPRSTAPITVHQQLELMMNCTHEEVYQLELMMKLICRSAHVLRFRNMGTHNLCCRDDDVRNPCRWTRVVCKDWEVTHIGWSGVDKPAGSVALEFLPPTVVKFSLSHRKVAGMVDIKRLPRAMEFILLEDCEAKGELDFTSLPPRMEAFIARKNHFTGVIVLSNLPETLTGIDLRDNEISHVVASALSLSEEFEHMYCTNLKDNVQFVGADGCKADSRLHLSRKKCAKAMQAGVKHTYFIPE